MVLLMRQKKTKGQKTIDAEVSNSDPEKNKRRQKKMSEIKKPAKTAVRKPANSTTKVPAKTPKQASPAVQREVSSAPQTPIYAAPVQQQQAPVNSAPESIIVQNVLKGPLYISDIGMEFGGLEVRDLTWEDPSVVKRSQDLRRAIQMGQLNRISQAEWDRIISLRAAEERAETQRISNRRTRNVNVDGRIIDAEVLNLNKADGGRTAQDQVSTAGYANDPMSYATAYQEARAQYEDRGSALDANTFASMVKNQPSLIPTLLRGDSIFSDGTLSGVSGRARATVITQGDGYSTGVSQMEMTNYNRDQRLAGSSAMGIGSLQNRDGMLDPNNPMQMPVMAQIPDFVDLDNLDDDDDAGYAEEIDLANDGSDDLGGGVRRLG